MTLSMGAGKSFHELGAVPYCQSCDARTIFCPHKIPKGTITVRVPKHATHLQLTRPIARLAPKSSSKSKGRVSKGKQKRSRASAVQAPAARASSVFPGAGADSTLEETPSSPGRRESTVAAAGGSASGTFEEACALKVPRDAIHRLPRSVETRSLHTMLGDFYLSLPPHDNWDDEEEDTASAPVPSRQHAFLTFLDDRYGVPEVATSVANDVYAAIQKRSGEDHHLRMVGHILDGTVDAVVARHYIFITKLLHKFEWEPTHETVTHIFHELFAFLNNEDRDEVQLEYESACADGVSKENLDLFLLGMVANQKEPWMLRGRAACTSYQTMTKGYMSLEDLQSMVTSSYPHFEKTEQDMIATLYRHSEAQHTFIGGKKKGIVPSARCGEILAYVMMQIESEEIVLCILDRLNGLSEWKRMQARQARDEQRQLAAAKKRREAAGEDTSAGDTDTSAA